jgi:hypothetical protein
MGRDVKVCLDAILQRPKEKGRREDQKPHGPINDRMMMMMMMTMTTTTTMMIMMMMMMTYGKPLRKHWATVTL